MQFVHFLLERNDFMHIKTKNVTIPIIKEHLEVSKISISTAKKLANSLRKSKIILKNFDKIYSSNQAKLDKDKTLSDKDKTLSDKDYKKESDMFNKLCKLFDTQKELANKLLTDCGLSTDTNKPSIRDIWGHTPMQKTTESSKDDDLADYL